MATIHRHRDKFQVRVRRKGFPTLTKTFHKLADAKEWARLIETQADRNELAPNRKTLDTTTLADLLTRYRDDVVPKKRHRETDTFAIELVLRHGIAKKRLSDLTHADFVAYADERLKEVSRATLKRQLTPLRHMFRLAREEWEIPLRESPLAKLKFKDADKKRERRLRAGEFEKLLEAAKKNRNRHVIPIARLALETAMRRGEILALRFRDVDIERCTATVRESKNGHSRTIPLSSPAVAILETTMAVMSEKNKAENARIFPITPLALRLSWDRLTKRAKIDDLHFHDLRHEAISRFFEKRLTVPEVASISGHRDMRMLLRYAHANHALIMSKLTPVTT